MTRIYWMEAKTEFLKLARTKNYSVATIALPLMIYAFFGLAMGKTQALGGVTAARYLLATYGAFSMIVATLYALGIGVALERGLGWLELKRASPMPGAAYLAAKMVTSLAFGAIVLVLLFGMGAVFGGVRMAAGEWLTMGGVLLAGAIPFCALGLTIGALAGANSAPAAVNMVYMPMAFCGGLWIPFEMLPKGVQQIAPLLPSYHLGQIALLVQHAPATGSIAQHGQALAAFALLFGGTAWLAWARQREKIYG